MLAVLAPAKTLDFSAPPFAVETSAPVFEDDARALVRALSSLAPKRLARLMKLSSSQARAVRAQLEGFESAPTGPAALTFSGEVFRGLDARSLDADALRFGQSHLSILSALYGALRPLDRIAPHRLEMSARVATERGHNLYAFWGERVTLRLREQLADHADRTLVDLASQEYTKVLWPRSLGARIVTCRFESYKDAARTPNLVPTHSRNARGAMARYLLERRAQRAEELQGFDRDGYRFVPERSDATTWVFGRPFP